jgi:hypothetical protein
VDPSLRPEVADNGLLQVDEIAKLDIKIGTVGHIYSKY